MQVTWCNSGSDEMFGSVRLPETFDSHTLDYIRIHLLVVPFPLCIIVVSFKQRLPFEELLEKEEK